MYGSVIHFPSIIFAKLVLRLMRLHRFFFGCIVTAVDFHLFCLLKKNPSSIEYLCYQLIMIWSKFFFYIYKGSYTRCKYDVFMNSISCLSSNMHFCNIEILIYTQYNSVFRSYGKLLICNTKILMETNLFCWGCFVCKQILLSLFCLHTNLSFILTRLILREMTKVSFNICP